MLILPPPNMRFLQGEAIPPKETGDDHLTEFYEIADFFVRGSWVWE
jgi:hypothetical protein